LCVEGCDFRPGEREGICGESSVLLCVKSLMALLTGKKEVTVFCVDEEEEEIMEETE
jgi:hypothetical protein